MVGMVPQKHPETLPISDCIVARIALKNIQFVFFIPHFVHIADLQRCLTSSDGDHQLQSSRTEFTFAPTNRKPSTTVEDTTYATENSKLPSLGKSLLAILAEQELIPGIPMCTYKAR